jgi:hypothetical protein
MTDVLYQSGAVAALHEDLFCFMASFGPDHDQCVQKQGHRLTNLWRALSNYASTGGQVSIPS